MTAFDRISVSAVGVAVLWFLFMVGGAVGALRPEWFVTTVHGVPVRDYLCRGGR